MSSFADKVAVVTGAGRGIGLAIARRLADGGAKVAIISRTEANSRQAAESINAKVRLDHHRGTIDSNWVAGRGLILLGHAFLPAAEEQRNAI